jgi:hypothetical protein
MWLSLPTEVVVEIFRRLDAADVVSCAGACRPWRRAIIDNASSLRPRPDRFNPSLLLGFVYKCDGVILRRLPGPFQSALPASTGGGGDGDEDSRHNHERICDLIPAASASAKGGADDNWPSILSSRDGFLLLARGLSRDEVELCLCNLMTGFYEFLPASKFWSADAYVLVSGYDLSPTESDDMAVGNRIRIVAVRKDNEYHHDRSMTLRYQHYLSSTPGTGSWGPVKRSPEIEKLLTLNVSPGREVLCGGVIYWLGSSIYAKSPTCSAVAAMDVRTGRTWTIELPRECQGMRSHALAATGDGRRLLLLWRDAHCVQVRVHIRGARWILQRKIQVPNNVWLWDWNGIFFPRSGFALVEKHDGGQALLVHVETGSSRPIIFPRATMANGRWGCPSYPYEMDWSTYLSKMNPFVTTGRLKRRARRPNPKIYGANWVNFE